VTECEVQLVAKKNNLHITRWHGSAKVV